MNNTDLQSRNELRIHGLDCAEEVSVLKRELVPLLNDEDRLGFDLLGGKLTVDLASLEVTQADVLAAIKRTGLKAEVWRHDAETQNELTLWSRNRRSILTATSGLFGASGLILQLMLAGGTSAASESVHDHDHAGHNH